MENQNQNQNPPQTLFSQVPELHKRHFRSFWPIVIIAVVSALVGGILVFLLFNQGLEEQLNSLLPGSNYNQTHKEVKDQEINTSGWQTYRNEEYGFELEYPSNSYTNPEVSNSTGRLNVRIENYSPSDDMHGLSKGQYYLEIFASVNKEGGNTNFCEEKLEEVESTKLFLEGKVFYGYPDQGGDAGGIRYALCTEVNNKNIYVQATENKGYLPTAKQILSTFKFIDPEISGNRILLTPENRSQYNKFGNEEEIKTSCETKFNFDLPNTSVIYTSQKWGFSFEVPFNNNWGNEKFKLNPYDVNSEGYVSYGPIGSFEGCGWSRDQSVTMLKKKTALEILAYLNRNGDYEQLTGLQKPEIVNINGLEVVKYEDNGLCYYPIMVVIGKNYNYEFRPLCGGTFKDVEARVKTVKLIE